MATSMGGSKVHFVKEQVSAAVGHSSVVVKSIACAVTVGYLLSFITSAIPFMTVTPGYVMPPNARVYSFFMFCFVELHFWHVVADICVVVLCGKLLEPLWGVADMVLFFVIVNLGVGSLTAIFYILAYLVTLNEDYLFDVHIHGLAGYIAGFCVAVKQVMPDYCVANMPFGKLRNTHIPLSLLVIIVVLRVLGALPAPYPYMFGFGVVISWVYLRFYQKHTNGNRGDMGDSFSFASFFPNHIQPVMGIVSTTVLNLLIKVKVCRKPQRRYDVSSPTTITVTLPGTQEHDAQRRKQLALKALNDRLHNVDPADPSPWPPSPDSAPLTPPTPLSPPFTPALTFTPTPTPTTSPAVPAPTSPPSAQSQQQQPATTAAGEEGMTHTQGATTTGP